MRRADASDVREAAVNADRKVASPNPTSKVAIMTSTKVMPLLAFRLPQSLPFSDFMALNPLW
jgi:hypothetical protein